MGMVGVGKRDSSLACRIVSLVERHVVVLVGDVGSGVVRIWVICLVWWYGCGVEANRKLPGAVSWNFWIASESVPVRLLFLAVDA